LSTKNAKCGAENSHFSRTKILDTHNLCQNLAVLVKKLETFASPTFRLTTPLANEYFVIYWCVGLLMLFSVARWTLWTVVILCSVSGGEAGRQGQTALFL